MAVALARVLAHVEALVAHVRPFGRPASRASSPCPHPRRAPSGPGCATTPPCARPRGQHGDALAVVHGTARRRTGGSTRRRSVRRGTRRTVATPADRSIRQFRSACAITLACCARSPREALVPQGGAAWPLRCSPARSCSSAAVPSPSARLPLLLTRTDLPARPHHGARHGRQPSPHRRPSWPPACTYVIDTHHAREPGRGARRATSAPATSASTWRGTSTAARSSQWCHDHGVRYLNTSVELWDPYQDAADDAPARAHAVRAPHGAAPHDRAAGAATRARRRWSSTAPTRAWCRTGRSRRSPRSRERCLCDDRPRPRHGRRRRGGARRAGTSTELAHALGRQGHPHRRARHADHRPAQAGRRVRQHLERRGLLRRGHRAGRDGLGHARAAPAARRLRCTPARARATRSAWPAWASTPGCARWVPTRRDHRHGRPPRRGVHHHRPPDGVGRRQAGLPAHGALRLLPVDAAIASLHELRDAPIRAAAAPAHHERRDHLAAATSWACC